MNPHLNELIQRRLTRRNALKGMAAAAAATVTEAGCTASAAGSRPANHTAESTVSTLRFAEVDHAMDPDVATANGYTCQVLLRWGDPILNEAPEFRIHAQSADDQLKQFGYNNDFITFLPLPAGSRNSNHGLLCVNHEYTNAELMFPRLTRSNKVEETTEHEVRVEMAAHGHSVVEIKRLGKHWQVIPGSQNRRLSALDTKMTISGPAAGHRRMKTPEDPAGREVIGMINNCAGGNTPWGTVLTCEENFQLYFGGDPAHSDEAENHARYGVAGSPGYGWYRFFDRYDVEKQPTSPNRFGWIVEFDPYDPKSVPVKRTALGRMNHEGATTAMSADGRLVVYSGDDQPGEYVYKFVTRDTCNLRNRRANRDLLDHGTLYVARFFEDGRLQWLPLEFGKYGLDRSNGFNSQGDVLIDTRRAADLLGATPLDRPEDTETNPMNGRVYMMLTNNRGRQPDEVDGPNPRAHNQHGQIIEMIPPVVDGRIDHAATEYRWELFLCAGNPEKPADQARYHEQVSEHGWLSCPDNCTFDNQGRLWIATDGAPNSSEISDGLYACDTEGPGRALTFQFLRGPLGSEVCSPCFTPDNRTLFVAIQHPGEGKLADGQTDSTYSNPSTRWPDFDPSMPPRPSVIAIVHDEGGVIGES